MKSIFLSIAITILTFAQTGQEIFKDKCSGCHIEYIPQSKLLINYEKNNTILKLKAPTLSEVSFRLRDQVGDRKADKESQLMEIEEFLLGYVNHPDRTKSILPKYVLKNFKTMPSVKISEEEAEKLAPFMFDFSEKMIVAHSVKRYSYPEALKKAKAENKIVMIEGFIPFCRGCIKMDREVFVEDKVKEALNRDFVVVKTNVLTQKLPLGLKSLGTPSFYFITNDGKRVIDTVQGTGDVQDFLELLEEIKDDLKNGKFLK